MKEAQSVGMLNSNSCEGEGGSSGQYEPISMKNILSAFVILISGVGEITQTGIFYNKCWFINVL